MDELAEASNEVERQELGPRQELGEEREIRSCSM